MKLGPDDHSRIVRRQVAKINPSILYEAYGNVGREAYDPVALLSIALYFLLKGVASPAQWCEQTHINEAAQWLGYGYAPARRTWYEFRDRMQHCITDLHSQLIQNSIAQGHLDPTVGVQDGTTFAACASRHRMVNSPTLEARRKLLAALINGSTVAHSPIPNWVPPTTDGRLELAKRMELANEILEQRKQKNSEKPSEKRKDPDKIQVSLTDPDAPLGQDKLKVYRPLYTVQYVVAPNSHLIMAYQCMADVCDTGTLAPMIDQVQRIVNGRLRCMMADAAYCTILDLQDCNARSVELLAPVQSNSLLKPKNSTNGVGLSNRDQFKWDQERQTYFCPTGHELKYYGTQTKKRYGGRTLIQTRYQCPAEFCMACSLAASCVHKPSSGRIVTRMEGQELLDAQQEKMSRPEIKERYKLRNQTVERGFADAKGNRRFDRYHGRGLARARTETGLLVLAQNLLRLDRLQRDALSTDKMNL